MATVYLVTSGPYYEYEVNRVFTTREQAEAWIGPGGKWYRVEEWEADAERGERVMLVYKVAIQMKSGEEHGVVDDPSIEIKPTAYRSETKLRDFHDGKTYIVGYSSVSREHALEVARAERQRRLDEATAHAARRPARNSSPPATCS